jgi:hypothetical protein
MDRLGPDKNCCHFFNFIRGFNFVMNYSYFAAAYARTSPIGYVSISQIFFHMKNYSAI